MVSFKQLGYALAVEKTLHFKNAALACNISQSALSTALNEMEKHLGIQVFERDNKKVLVTAAGREVLRRAREIMLQMEDLQHLADSHKAPLCYPLTLGVIPTIAQFLLPRILPALGEEYPEATINLVEDQSHILVEKVRNGELDAAVLALPYACEGLLTMEFWQEDFYWVARGGEPHTGQEEISNEELKSCNLMLLNDGHCLKDHILDTCKLADRRGSHGFAASSLPTLIEMVKGGMGSTLIPAMALKQLTQEEKTLSAVHLNEPSPHRRIAFVVRPNYTRLSSIEALMVLCKNALQQD